MDGKSRARRERWIQRAEAAYQRMFEGKSEEELVTLTQRENMAVLIGKELAAFLLEEHVAMDRAAQPGEASTTCCPKCGQPGTPAVVKGEEVSERTVTTRVGQIRVRRQRWECGKCRIVFFSAGRPARLGDGRL
jgi:transposase